MLHTAERVQMLRRMNQCGLEPKFATIFPLAVLNAACARIEDAAARGDAYNTSNERIQKELIQNPAFGPFYYTLSDHDVSDHLVNAWLTEADRLGDVLTDTGTVQQFLALSAAGIHTPERQYEALRYFPNKLDDETEGPVLVSSLNALHQEVCHLSDLETAERNLLLLPFFHKYILIRGRTVQDTMRLLAENTALQDVLSYLYAEGVWLQLEQEDLSRLACLRDGDAELFAQIFMNLETDVEAMGEFIFLWRENLAPRYDLEWLARLREPLSKDARDALLQTRLGYLSGLYSGKLHIPFENVPKKKIPVLTYAIANKKQRFLSVVTENYDLFASLRMESMLFQEDFYLRCNLNSLTAKDLAACDAERGRELHLNLLPQRIYTFQELHLLRYAREVYFILFGLLDDLTIDRRLIVMRELVKKDLLSDDVPEDQLQQLAACLSQKPLSVWRRQELGHIQGLSAADALRILQVYDTTAHLLPDIHTWEEAAFAARNADQVQQYEGWGQAREHIIESDKDWHRLVKLLKLSDEFVQENRSDILRFLFNEGAEMSRVFYEKAANQEGFRRILQAELMGKFKTLKYFPDDLVKEISFPLGEEQQRCWQENTSLAGHGFSAAEVDDFYSTLRIGELPRQTCLCYSNGCHKDCLLAGFDSNKKILLARRGNEVVARAVIRLTKGTFYQPRPEEKGMTSLQFADLLNDSDGKANRAATEEHLVLFLERLYTSHVSDSEEDAIRKLFVHLVHQKADRMGALSVLAYEYTLCYEEGQFASAHLYLYISKSKSGAQYLDSLSGEASVSKEGSYGSGLFLVSQDTKSSNSEGESFDGDKKLSAKS